MAQVSKPKTTLVFSPPPPAAAAMDSDSDNNRTYLIPANSSSGVRGHSGHAQYLAGNIMNKTRSPIRWRLSFRRRRQMPTVRLGGKKARRGFFLARAFRRLKVRSLKLGCSGLLKKLKAFWSSLVKDMLEAGIAMEELQQRMLFETAFAVPVMGFSMHRLPENHHVV